MAIRFMSRQDIADYLGVTLSAVKKYSDFPEPDAYIGRNQGWTRDTIDEWNATRRTRQSPGEND